jgi:hypothetical protein
MKLIFSSPDSVEVGLLKGQLDVAGISCEVRNEFAAPFLVGAVFNQELWVDDADFPAADELLRAWRTAPEQS